MHELICMGYTGMCPCFVNERVAGIHRGGGESVLLWVQKSTEGEIGKGLFINLVGMFFERTE